MNTIRIAVLAKKKETGLTNLREEVGALEEFLENQGFKSNMGSTMISPGSIKSYENDKQGAKIVSMSQEVSQNMYQRVFFVSSESENYSSSARNAIASFCEDTLGYNHINNFDD